MEFASQVFMVKRNPSEGLKTPPASQGRTKQGIDSPAYGNMNSLPTGNRNVPFRYIPRLSLGL